MPTISSYWQYIDHNCPPLLDPRVNITKQMAWIMPSRATNTIGVEPDNYNLAIFNDRPCDMKFIKDQCWYKIDQTFRRNKIRGWIGVYIADTPEEQFLFNREVLVLQPRAVWRYPNARARREKRPLLERENQYKPKSATNFTTEERLYQLGYFEKLQNKYFYGDERFIKVLGTPRGCVLNPIYQSNESEADYCDN